MNVLTDFNDLHQMVGADAVKLGIERGKGRTGVHIAAPAINPYA